MTEQERDLLESFKQKMQNAHTQGGLRGIMTMEVCEVWDACELIRLDQKERDAEIVYNYLKDDGPKFEMLARSLQEKILKQ